MNLTKLNDIQALEINNSLINETTEILPNLVSNSNELTNGYFGLGIMIITFIVLLIAFMTDQDVFRLKFANALAASSGITLLIGSSLLVSGVTSSFSHVMWFAILFALSLVLVNYDKT